MDTTTIAEKLRELEERFAHELLPEEERLQLRERILKLKKKTETTAGRSQWPPQPLPARPATSSPSASRPSSRGSGRPACTSPGASRARRTSSSRTSLAEGNA